MSQFPTIANISQFRPLVESENFLFRESNGNIVSFYMIQGQDTFSGENSNYKRESRGIVFDAVSGEIVSRPLHKFFNVMEKDFTQPDVIAWDDVERIMVKRDGSMVHPIRIAGVVTMKTKKTHESREAKAATEFMNGTPKMLEWITTVMMRGHTPIFEFTSPSFPIVVQYPSDALTLLHIRDNVSGEYFNLQDYISKFGEIPFPLVEDVSAMFLVDGKVSWDAIKEWANHAQQVEGVVIQFKSGEMMKVKTEWYRELHRSIVFIRVRDVVKTTLSDGIDDLIAAFRMCGRPESTQIQVLKIQKQVLEEVLAIRHYCEAEARKIPVGADRKTAYVDYVSKSKYPSMVMNVWLGKENDYIEFYRKTEVQNWPLDVIVDLNED